MNESRKKLTDLQLGRLVRRFDEVSKRITKGSLNYENTLFELQLLNEGKGWIIDAALNNPEVITITNGDGPYKVPLQYSIDEDMLAQQIYLTRKKTESLLENQDLVFEETIRALQLIIEDKGFLMRLAENGVIEVPNNSNRFNIFSSPESIAYNRVDFNKLAKPIVFCKEDYKLMRLSETKNGLDPYFCNLRKRSPNIDLFNFLLNNQRLIPRDWQEKWVCSLGTIFFDEYEVHPHIPVLLCISGFFHLNLLSLESDFDEKFSFLVFQDSSN